MRENYSWLKQQFYDICQIRLDQNTKTRPNSYKRPNSLIDTIASNHGYGQNNAQCISGNSLIDSHNQNIEKLSQLKKIILLVKPNQI